jgi:hypothetical protein
LSSGFKTGFKKSALKELIFDKKEFQGGDLALFSGSHAIFI